jgi:hypothetical protein
MKTIQVNIRLEQEKIDVLDTLAEKGLNRQAVARVLLWAAIEAIQESQGHLHFPPRFKIPAESFELPEPSARYKTRK